MPPFAYYLLKVTVLSGLLLGYYWFFLRNKIFHGYNRFYLLAIVVLSLCLPLLRIDILAPAAEHSTKVIKVISVVTAGDDYVNDVIVRSTSQPHLSFAQILSWLYVLVCFVFFLLMLQMLYTIYRLIRQYNSTETEGICFINTANEKGTPFSFFSYIFWNSEIDPGSPSGNRIFKHEVAHIRERHSLDKLFVNIVLMFFWSNPVFWLIRKELNMIQEFIADKRAVEDGDTAAFAAMILETAYPRHRMHITNPFFYSPIKRRLMMLTKNQHPKMNYFSRLLVLPLAIVVFSAFVLKAKTIRENSKYKTDPVSQVIHSIAGKTPAPAEGNGVARTIAGDHYTDQPITVVIDAGHGGEDKGATNLETGYSEKELTLLLAKKIVSLNDNINLNLILTRNDDRYSSPKDKAAFARLHKADLFISIHINDVPIARAGNYSGLEVFVPQSSLPQFPESQLLASAVIGSFQSHYGINVAATPCQRGQIGITVLDANNIPSVLIEAGFINNPGDFNYLTLSGGQENFARNVLNAINDFASAAKSSLSSADLSDSLGVYKGKKIISLTVTNYNDKILLALESGEKVSLTRAECERLKIKLPPPPPDGKYKLSLAAAKANENIDASQDFSIDGKKKNPPILSVSGNTMDIPAFIVIDQKISTKEMMNKLSPEEISEVNVLKGERAVSKYGERAAGGAVEIKTKTFIKANPDRDPVFSIGDFSKPRLALADFKKQTEIRVSDGYEISSATVFFSGAGFPTVEVAKLSGNALAGMKSQTEKSMPGTAVTFVNVQVKGPSGLMTIEDKSFLLY